ncbi:phosphoribosylamine--glycine ligase [groundwater metagenome]
MKVLLVGGGGREHAIAEAISRSQRSPELFAVMSKKNPGIARLCKMNLAVHGLSGDIREGNSYYEDIHKSAGKFDFVMASIRMFLAYAGLLHFPK